jgi:hypothetical protein
MFWGTIWYLMKKSQFKETLAKIDNDLQKWKQESAKDVETLKLYNKSLESKIDELTNDVNHFKIKQGIGRSV